MRKILTAGLTASLFALTLAPAAFADQSDLFKAQAMGRDNFRDGGIPGQNGFPATNTNPYRPAPGGGPGPGRPQGFNNGRPPGFANGRPPQFNNGGPRQFGGGDHGYRHGGYGGAVGAGVAGLAAGALIGGALANQQPYYGGYGQPYDEPVYAPPVYAPPQPAYADDSDDVPDVESPADCAARYRSYDPRSGTYLGFDGMRHPCG